MNDTVCIFGRLSHLVHYMCAILFSWIKITMHFWTLLILDRVLSHFSANEEPNLSKRKMISPGFNVPLLKVLTHLILCLPYYLIYSTTWSNLLCIKHFKKFTSHLIIILLLYNRMLLETFSECISLKKIL